MDSPYPFKRPLILDGATGTNLFLRGMPLNSCVEKWIIENPEEIKELQTKFIEAGADIIYAPTFSANKARLATFGFSEKVVEFNESLVKLSKSIANDKAFVAGDISPTGLVCKPFGDTSFDELIDIYYEQALAQFNAGCDLFVIETMYSMSEMRAAILACKRFNLPIFVTITVDEDGKTLYNATALTCLITLQDMGISAFGLNCSYGPEKMAQVIKKIAPFSKIPLIAKPNAGLPKEDNDSFVYDLTADVMGKMVIPLLDNGVEILGGCCGTTPEHLAVMRKVVDTYDFSKVKIQKQDTSLILSNSQELFYLRPDVICFSQPLICFMDMSDDIIEAEHENIDVIIIEVHTPDDGYCFAQNSHMAKLPVMFRSHNEEALKSALHYYNGRAMVDKKTMISQSNLSIIANKYGAIIY